MIVNFMDAKISKLQSEMKQWTKIEGSLSEETAANTVLRCKKVSALVKEINRLRRFDFNERDAAR